MRVDVDPPRPRAWPVLAAYAVAFLLALGSSLLLVFAWARATVSDRSQLGARAQAVATSAPGLMVGALTEATVFFLVALVVARLEGPPIARRLRLGPTRASPLGIVYACVGLVGLNLACATAGELLGARGDVIDMVTASLRASNPARFVAALATLALAPGIAEETFFRGLFQTRVIASWGRWPGIVATSLAFAVVHLDLLQGSVAFGAGLFLGWIADRVGGIRPTIIAHVVNNATFVTVTSFGSIDDGPRAAQAAAVAVGFALLAGSVLLLRTAPALREG